MHAQGAHHIAWDGHIDPEPASRRTVEPAGGGIQEHRLPRPLHGMRAGQLVGTRARGHLGQARPDTATVGKPRLVGNVEPECDRAPPAVVVPDEEQPVLHTGVAAQRDAGRAATGGDQTENAVDVSGLQARIGTHGQDRLAHHAPRDGNLSGTQSSGVERDHAIRLAPQKVTIAAPCHLAQIGVLVGK